MRLAAMSAISVLALSGCGSNGLEAGEKYCVGGMEAYYMGHEYQLGSVKFLVDGGGYIYAWPEAARSAEECANE